VITSLVLSIQGRSCAHAIYSLSCVVDYYVNCGSMINIYALDLSKAFDKMSHYWLLIKLMERAERRIPDMLLYVIEHWFSIGCTCVKWGTYVSRYFNLSCWVRQRGVLSPYLFAIYIYWQCLWEGCGHTRWLSCKVGMCKHTYVCRRTIYYYLRPPYQHFSIF